MNFTDHTIFFPLGRLSEAFVETYLTRYTDPETGLAAVHWDDAEHTRRRKASLFDGSIEPTPAYDAEVPPPGEVTDEWRTEHLTGHHISAGWPELFLADLERDPQPEPELFSGIAVVG